MGDYVVDDAGQGAGGPKIVHRQTLLGASTTLVLSGWSANAKKLRVHGKGPTTVFDFFTITLNATGSAGGNINQSLGGATAVSANFLATGDLSTSFEITFEIATGSERVFWGDSIASAASPARTKYWGHGHWLGNETDPITSITITGATNTFSADFHVEVEEVF